VSHGNAAPECGFSINKGLLVTHGNSLDSQTLVALRIVKGGILNAGGFLNVPLTKQLLTSVKTSYQKYQADLEAKRKFEEEAMKKQVASKKLEESTKDVIDRKINIKKLGITVAEEAIAAANEKLQQILKEPTISRVQLQKVQSSLEMSIKRKRCLEKEVTQLER